MNFLPATAIVLRYPTIWVPDLACLDLQDLSVLSCHNRSTSWASGLILEGSKFTVFGLQTPILLWGGRILALQCCGGLCHTSTWISHNYNYISSLLGLPALPIPPCRSLQRPRLGSLCYTAASHIYFRHDNVYMSQSEVSQKEKNKYHILMPIHRI